MIAQWFAPDPAQACDAFVVMVGTRPLRVTIFQTRASGASHGPVGGDSPPAPNPNVPPYAVDALIMPLAENGPQRGWLVFAAEELERAASAPTW